jgi:hypothetical protein
MTSEMPSTFVLSGSLFPRDDDIWEIGDRRSGRVKIDEFLANWNAIGRTLSLRMM